MKCPVGKHELVVASTEGPTGWQCSACSGVWLPKSFITAYEFAHPGFVSPFCEGLAVNTASDSELDCPEGHGFLQESISMEIELDWCKTCKGVWFDQGEIKQMMKSLTKEKDSPFGWPEIVLELFIFMGVGRSC